jgi:hypothetical protein
MSYPTVRKAQHQQDLEVEIMHWTDDGTGTVKSLAIARASQVRDDSI